GAAIRRRESTMPDKDPCGLLRGPAVEFCRKAHNERGHGRGGGGGGGGGGSGGGGPMGQLADLTADMYRMMDKTMTGKWDVKLDGNFMEAYEPVLFLGLLVGVLTWLVMTLPVALGRERSVGNLARSTGAMLVFAACGGFAPAVFWIVFGTVADLISALGQPEGESFADMAKRMEEMKEGPAAFLGLLASALCLGGMWLLSMLRGVIVILGAIFSSLVASTLVRGHLTDLSRLWWRYMWTLLLSPAVISLAMLIGIVLPDRPLFDVLELIVIALCLIGLFVWLPVIGSTLKAVVHGAQPDGGRITASLEKAQTRAVRRRASVVLPHGRLRPDTHHPETSTNV
ncbi:hypothetical protein AB0I84_51075, partial [Streptomyces spectabilis]|uniref:hypothetical protein n=1 Tax=Streptomyces spectabilis TaxID=68270 RepID=UPI0034110EEA